MPHIRITAQKLHQNITSSFQVISNFSYQINAKITFRVKVEGQLSKYLLTSRAHHYTNFPKLHQFLITDQYIVFSFFGTERQQVIEATYNKKVNIKRYKDEI